MSIATVKAAFVAMFNFEKVQTSDQPASIDRMSQTFAEQIVNTEKGTEILVNLPLANWGGDKKQTVTATGVTVDNDVWVYPPSERTAYEMYNNSKISCVAQGVNSLTFEYGTIPISDISNVIITIK